MHARNRRDVSQVHTTAAAVIALFVGIVASVVDGAALPVALVAGQTAAVAAATRPAAGDTLPVDIISI